MDPYLGEIRIFAGNYAPTGWALCNGQPLSIAQNAALFAVLGLTYGGNGNTTFNLPDFRGRAPMHWGSGSGLSPHVPGEVAGSTTVTLNASQLPTHSHPLNGVSGRAQANANSPANTAFAPSDIYASSSSNTVQMSQAGTGPTGSGQPHNNIQPFLAMTFIIALQGVFPPRS